MRLGIDIGGTILRSLGGGPAKGSLIEGAAEGVRRLVEMFHPNNVFLLSKAKNEKTVLRTLQDLLENNFFSATGVLPTKVFFLKTAKEKIEEIHRLGLSHMIDNAPALIITLRGKIENLFLFRPKGRQVAPRGVHLIADWSQIVDILERDLRDRGQA
ncbi:MAG: hypothetical protein HY747_08340 [Elusimicrobia bacterium]|nr:hypothetical protein [Elusimicrobiota bacterium]